MVVIAQRYSGIGRKRCAGPSVDREKREEEEEGRSAVSDGHRVPQGNKENALSRIGRLWIPSWPIRAARPKSEKPMTFARRDMTAGAGIIVLCYAN